MCQWIWEDLFILGDCEIHKMSDCHIFVESAFQSSSALKPVLPRVNILKMYCAQKHIKDLRVKTQYFGFSLSRYKLPLKVQQQQSQPDVTLTGFHWKRKKMEQEFIWQFRISFGTKAEFQQHGILLFSNSRWRKTIRRALNRSERFYKVKF